MKILYITYENVFRTGILQAMVIKPLSLMTKEYNIEFTITSIYKTHEKDPIYQKNKDNNLKNYPNLNIVEFKKSLNENHSVTNLIKDFIPIIKFSVKASRNHDLLHCRAYGGALVGLITNKITKVPYIFDMRGTLPEESVEMGKISSKSLKYRLLKLFEEIMIRNASYVFTVSNKFKEYIIQEYNHSNVVNINNPTDFSAYSTKKNFNKPITMIYSGSMQVWHAPKVTIDYFKKIYEELNRNVYLIFCTNNKEEAKSHFQKSGLPDSAYEINSVPFDEMPYYYQRAHIAFCFIKNSFSKSVCFPVKFSEYIASELFVMTNKNIGDLEEIVENYNCGFAVNNLDDIDKNIAQIIPPIIKIKEQKSTGYSRKHLSFLDWKQDSIKKIYRTYKTIKSNSNE